LTSTECAAGDDPSDPNDDYNCENIPAEGFDICDYITNNPDSDLATLDCDGGGVTNASECENGGDPLDDTDECIALNALGTDICAVLTLNPDSPIGALDRQNAQLVMIQAIQTMIMIVIIFRLKVLMSVIILQLIRIQILLHLIVMAVV